jgi:glycosyltransferase involved in cell wall biosynthesis
MRILMTTDTIGGVWTYTKELTTELLASGCAVALVSFGRTPSSAQQRWSDAVSSRWRDQFRYIASDTPLEWMADNDQAYSEGAELLMRVADDFGAELIHSSQFCFGALSSNLPRVVVAHSDVLSWAQACRGGRLEASGWLDRYRSLVTEGLCGADSIVAPTQWMLDALAANFPLPEDACVISNGRTLPNVRTTESRKLQAVTAGRLWDEAKNLKLLADVHSPMPLLLAGETKHKSINIPLFPGNAVLLGSLEENQLLQLFRQSAIYLCLSQYEPFGLSPLEAALCGCAIVANDIPSLHEVWGDAALFFEDAESLSVLLNKLYSEPDLLADAQRSAWQRARQFSAKRMAVGYFALFQRMLTRTEAQRDVA